MNHDVNNLTTIADCDSLISSTTEELSNLGFMRTKQEFQISNDAELLQEIDSEIAVKQQALVNLQNLLPTLPEGKRKNDCLDDIANTENDILTLEIRKLRKGNIRQFMEDYDLFKINSRQIKCQDFKSQIETRRGQIPS